ncbi:MAG: hypothetical protein WAN65_17845 [Candidatus Sulfotelmatobacter sp.]
MSQFYEVDANFFGTTTEELNRVALERGGVLKSIGYGYAVRGKSISTFQLFERFPDQEAARI